MRLRERVAVWLLKSSASHPSAWFLDWIGGATAASGLKVGPSSSQGSAVVSACVQVRSQDIAKLPLILYRKSESGERERAESHPLFDLIGRRPNARQTSYEFREMMQAALDLHGNAYALIKRGPGYLPEELIPLHDDWVNPMMSTAGKPFYDVRMWGLGSPVRYSGDDILHLRDRSEDGFIGKSVISRAKDVIGLDLAAQMHASKLYANGARPGGILSTAGKVGADGRKIIKQEFVDEFGGAENAYKVMVGAEGMEYKPIGMNNVDADFVNGWKLTREQVASLFRVPPHMVGIMDHATFSNIEHQRIEYVTDTLMPIATRWEQALNRALLKESEQGSYFFEFLFDALLRGDFKSRMEGYAIARNAGLLSANEIRKKDNWPSIGAAGDEYWRPVNMTLAGTPVADPTKQQNNMPANQASLGAPADFLRIAAE